MTSKPWRSAHFAGGYSAEFLPPGQRSWRIVKEGGKPKIFPTPREAFGAAQDAYLARCEPSIRATLPVDPDRIAAKLMAEAEDWLRSDRRDVQNKTIMRRPGHRPIMVMPGRAKG